MGGVPPTTTVPVTLDTNGIATAWSFVQGLDPVLDNQIKSASGRRLQTLDPSLDQSIRVKLSNVFASTQGLNLTEKLMTDNEQFADWNNALADEYQEGFCSLVSGINSTVSQAVKDCLCGVTSKPFVHCAALLEAELNAVAGAAARRRQLRSSDQYRRKNLACDISIGGIDPLNPLGGVLGLVANQFQEDPDPTGLCFEASCGVPIPAFPVLEVDLGLEVCPAGLPSLGSTGDEAIYEVLAGTKVSLSAGSFS